MVSQLNYFLVIPLLLLVHHLLLLLMFHEFDNNITSVCPSLSLPLYHQLPLKKWGFFFQQNCKRSGYKMATISGLITSCAVHPKLSFNSQRYIGSRYKINGITLVSKGIDRIQHSFRAGSHAIYVCSVGRNQHELTFDNNVSEEPFWSTLTKEFLWGLKSLLAFLAQQPSQLKYIEWPSFPSTLKTATLTLVLVALLIIALSSVDAVLSYLLALLIRKTL